jgi:hypothetical protein
MPSAADISSGGGTRAAAASKRFNRLRANISFFASGSFRVFCETSMIAQPLRSAQREIKAPRNVMDPPLQHDTKIVVFQTSLTFCFDGQI